MLTAIIILSVFTTILTIIVVRNRFNTTTNSTDISRHNKINREEFKRLDKEIKLLHEYLKVEKETIKEVDQNLYIFLPRYKTEDYIKETTKLVKIPDVPPLTDSFPLTYTTHIPVTEKPKRKTTKKKKVAKKTVKKKK